VWWDGRLSPRHRTTPDVGHPMFQFFERIRRHPAAEGLVNFFGYFYLSLWNHLFGRVPLYWFRHLVVRHLYGLRMGRSNLHRAVTLLSPWLIRIGDNVNIQMGCFLDGRGGLTIGNNVDVTPGVRILTEQHDIDSPDYATVKKPVVIQDNVVIGGWAMILPGVTVGEGAVIASGAVVVKNVDPYTLVAGNPAVKKRDRARDVRYRLDYRRPFH
jgi:acetyltransferase-like isoleucine patch superfamily enzyme